MSLNRRIAWGIAANYSSRAAQIILNLSLIPLLFTHLSAEEVGIWFLISQAGMFIGLLNFGFGPTLTRRIAFAKGLSGSHVDVTLSEESLARISDLAGTGRVLYRYLAAIIFIVAGTTGAFFLNKIEPESINQSEVLAAWGLICLSYAVNTWEDFWNSLLSGLGYVGSVGFFRLLFQILELLAKITVVLLGGGLIHLALVQCTLGLLSRQFLRSVVRRRHPELKNLIGQWHGETFHSMLRPAILCWLTSLGAFLILRTDQYFIAFFKGADELPNYQAAYSMMYNIYMLSGAISASSSVFYSQLWSSGSHQQMRAIINRNVLIALAVMICGVLVVVTSSPAIFDLWLGEGHFVGSSVILIFGITFILEANQHAFAYASRATEDEAFACLTIAAGIINLFLTGALIKPFGIAGVAAATLVAQLITTNWYVVYRSHRRLGISLREYAFQILMPLLALSGIIYVPLRLVSHADFLQHLPFLRLALSFGWSGIVLLVFLWQFALTAGERSTILKWPRRKFLSPQSTK